MTKSTWTRPLLLAMLLLAFALRLYRLDYQELRGDEVFGYFFSLRPLTEIVPATLELREPHPVASYYLQHIWFSLFRNDNGSHSEFVVRFPSAWFGLLAVALLYGLGKQLARPSTALWATFLLACSPYAIWHSQDARMYSMSLALTTASTWLLVRWLQRRHQMTAIAYILTTLLALHTHYFTAFIVVAQNLFVLLRTVQSRYYWSAYLNWLILQITVLFFYGPWLLRAQGILGSYGGNGDSPSVPAMLTRSLSVFLVGESTPSAQRVYWAWFAILLLLIASARLWQEGGAARRTLLLLVLYLFLPLFATWWSARTRPIFNERYLVAALPGFYLLLSALCPPRTVGKKSVYYLSTALVVFCCLGAIVSLQHHYRDPLYSKSRGWRALATTLQQWSSGTAVDDVRIAQNFPDPTLWYYYRGAVEHIVLPPQPHDAEGAQATVATLLDQGVQRVLLPLQPAPNWDDNGLADGALRSGFVPVREAQVGVWPLRLYQRPFEEMEPLSVSFQNGLQLTGFVHAPQALHPHDVLVVALTWDGEIVVPADTLTLFVQLLNPQGELVAQSDRPFPDDVLSTHQPSYYDILLPASLTQGSYRLIMGLYDSAAAGAPRILTQTAEDHVELTVFTVEGM